MRSAGTGSLRPAGLSAVTKSLLIRFNCKGTAMLKAPVSEAVPVTVEVPPTISTVTPASAVPVRVALVAGEGDAGAATAGAVGTLVMVHCKTAGSKGTVRSCAMVMVSVLAVLPCAATLPMVRVPSTTVVRGEVLVQVAVTPLAVAVPLLSTAARITYSKTVRLMRRSESVSGAVTVRVGPWAKAGTATRRARMARRHVFMGGVESRSGDLQSPGVGGNPGSTRVSRVGFGVLAETDFRERTNWSKRFN